MALIKTTREIKKIEVAGTILASVLKQVAAAAVPGTPLTELEALARKLIAEAGAAPSFLGYQPEGAARPYPAVLCASLNEVVVHGVPTERRLAPGDLLKLDLGVQYQGFHADAAVTVPVGAMSARAARLTEVTRHALAVGIKALQPGRRLGDVGYAISRYVRRSGFSVVKGLTGHGIGRALHEEPSVLNEGSRGTGLVLKPGMVLAIEPMVAAGKPDIIQLPDESYATADKSLAAHFEHTVVIEAGGPRILTGDGASVVH